MINLLYKYREVIKFSLVGMANTLFTISIIFLLNKVLGISYLIVNPIAYFLPTISSFYMNKKWTFKSEGNVKKEGALFFIVIGVAWCIQYCFLFIMVEKMHMDSVTGQIIGMGRIHKLKFCRPKVCYFSRVIEYCVLRIE